MTEVPKFQGCAFEAQELTAARGPELQTLLEQSSDYFETVVGRPTDRAEAQALFYTGPEEGHDFTGKMLYGISARGRNELCGVLDAFRGYPHARVWYIGLLLLSPQARRSGIGQDIVEAFCLMARQHGADEVQLNVVEQNVLAYQFWQRCGFTETKRWMQRYGARASIFIRMHRVLG